MRLVILAISLPVAFIVAFITAWLTKLWFPQCGLLISTTAFYLTLIPIVYYAKPYLTLSIKPFAISLTMLAGLWAIIRLITPPIFNFEITRQQLTACPNWELHFLISAVILAPLVEEALFRAILYVELERRVGALGGYLGNSLAFAVVHGMPFWIPIYFAYGIVLTYAFRKGGFLAAVMLHSLNNLLAFISLLSP